MWFPTHSLLSSSPSTFFVLVSESVFHRLSESFFSRIQRMSVIAFFNLDFSYRQIALNWKIMQELSFHKNSNSIQWWINTKILHHLEGNCSENVWFTAVGWCQLCGNCLIWPICHTAIQVFLLTMTSYNDRAWQGHHGSQTHISCVNFREYIKILGKLRNDFCRSLAILIILRCLRGIASITKTELGKKWHSVRNQGHLNHILGGKVNHWNTDTQTHCTDRHTHRQPYRNTQITTFAENPKETHMALTWHAHGNIQYTRTHCTYTGNSFSCSIMCVPCIYQKLY